MENTQEIPAWDLADRMRKALRHSGIDVQDMADYLGVSRSAVSKWITGRISPKAGILRLWAMRCGVDYEWLATGQGVRIRGFSTLPAVAA